MNQLPNETREQYAARLIRIAASLEVEIKHGNDKLEAAVAALPEKVELEALKTMHDQARGALRGLFDEAGGKVETEAGKVELIPQARVEYTAESVRLFCPELAPLVIKKIPEREEVDKTTLERMVKAAVKNETLESDTLEKLKSKAIVTKLAPRFVITPVKAEQAPADDAAATVAPF